MMMRNVCMCMALIWAIPIALAEVASAEVVATWNGGKVQRDDYDSWRNVMQLEDGPDAIREFVFVQSFAELARKRGAESDPGVKLENEIARRKILSAALRSQAVSQIRISDEEIESLRLAYPEAFVRPRKLQLRNLYKKLGSEPAAAESVRIRMNELRQQLLDGSDFAELARAESESQSRFQDGRLGFVDPADLPPAIRDAVSGLKPGRISEVIENDGAVMIFRCDEIKAAVTPTAEEVRAKLRTNLLQIRKEEIEKSLGEHLLESAQVEITPASTSVVLSVGDYRLDTKALAALMKIKVPRSSASDWDDEARTKLLRNWAIGVLEERLAIERSLDSRAATAGALRWQPTQVLARNELVRRIDKELKNPSEEAMRSFYTQNTGRYRIPEQFTLGVISFGRVPSNDSKAAGQFIARAERVEHQIASGELSFADAARRFSEAPSASRGGVSRTLTRPQIGALGSVAAKAVAELAPGQHTELLRLRSGLWMFELLDRQPARKKRYAEAKDAVRSELRKQQVRQLETLLRERQWRLLKIHLIADPDPASAAGAR